MHWMRHDMTFFFNEAGAKAAVKELERDGFAVVADEEVTGDSYWHVAAFRVQTDAGAHEASNRMESLATRLGGKYCGWELVHLGDGSLPNPLKPLP
jgi:hypothetical protein